MFRLFLFKPNFIFIVSSLCSLWQTAAVRRDDYDESLRQHRQQRGVRPHRRAGTPRRRQPRLQGLKKNRYRVYLVFFPTEYRSNPSSQP